MPTDAPCAASGARFQAHDLLRLHKRPSIWPDAPPWVSDALRQAPFVVVRRLTPPAGMICVGVRGPTRAHRHGGVMPVTPALARITPESLANVPPAAGRIAQIPALAVLPRVRALCASFGMTWGPTGSVGFELASGTPVATPASDLDLILRAADPLPLPVARALADALDVLSHDGAIRFDVQMETPHGAVALTEYAAAAAQMLLRTAAGPRMVADPWRAGGDGQPDGKPDHHDFSAPSPNEPERHGRAPANDPRNPITP